jgi:viologen exporter family transport system permease protein
MRKYLRIFSYSIRNAFAYLPSYLFRNIFFAVVLYVFFSLWRAVYSSGSTLLAGYTMAQLLWYLTATEAVELSKTQLVSDIQDEVKDGTLAYSLQRPYSYMLYHFSRSLGESIVKLLPILVVGFTVALLAVGPLPHMAASIAPALLLIAGGIVLNTLWYLLIGLLAFWTEEVMPFYWVLQKLVFVLGGMFFPIDLFPKWLQGVSKALPFAFSAYWPGRVFVTGDRTAFITGLAGQLIYAALLFALAGLLFRTAVRRVQVQGG